MSDIVSTSNKVYTMTALVTEFTMLSKNKAIFSWEYEKLTNKSTKEDMKKKKNTSGIAVQTLQARGVFQHRNSVQWGHSP